MKHAHIYYNIYYIIHNDNYIYMPVNVYICICINKVILIYV